MNNKTTFISRIPICHDSMHTVTILILVRKITKQNHWYIIINKISNSSLCEKWLYPARMFSSKTNFG